MFKNYWKNRSPEESSPDGEISFIISERDDAATLFEIKKSSECIPEWWKSLSNTYKSDFFEKDMTLKSCIPVTDAMMSGYMLVLKHDLHIKYNEEDKKTEVSSDFERLKESFSYHSKEQVATMPMSEEYVDDLVFKWVIKHSVKTPKGYSCLFVHPLNQAYLPFYTLSGVVDTDKFFMPVHFPFLMKNNYEGVIPKGTPIVQIIPFKRDSWNFKKYNNPGIKFEHKQEFLRRKYHAGRTSKEGKVIGGVYKKQYRSRKEY